MHLETVQTLNREPSQQAGVEIFQVAFNSASVFRITCRTGSRSAGFSDEAASIPFAILHLAGAHLEQGRGTEARFEIRAGRSMPPKCLFLQRHFIDHSLYHCLQQ